MSKHTPGPWEARMLGGGKGGPNSYRIARSGPDVEGAEAAVARVHGRKDGVGRANARLIAAAPELLEAARQALRMYRAVQPVGGWQGVEEELEYVIAKALP